MYLMLFVRKETRVVVFAHLRSSPYYPFDLSSLIHEESFAHVLSAARERNARAFARSRANLIDGVVNGPRARAAR